MDAMIAGILALDGLTNGAIYALLALATVPLFVGMASLHLAGALHRERSGLGILAVTALANAMTNALAYWGLGH